MPNSLPRVLARILVALLAGLVFGLGLSISGMLDPARVQGFLDVSGAWDPSLAFVLGGAVAVTFIGVRICRRLERPALDVAFHLPKPTGIDRRLVLGSAIFGIGWGIAGFCPGPAIAALAFGNMAVVLFVGAMIAGTIIHDRWVSP